MAHIYPQDWIYAIINSVDLPNVDFNEDIYPTNATALRSWADCLTLMQTPAWSEPEPVEE
jgi:hypothetical protein